MTDVNKAENNLPTDLNQLTVEIKFYVNQWGQNTIEIGKRLIAAKKLVAQGEWLNWLEKNFNLTERTAQNFMRIAERFGKTKLISDLNSTQMIAMLSLPKGEEEKFIAAKAAEDTPVETMKVKELRDEVAKWKTDYEQKKSEVENLFHDNENLKSENARLEKIRGSLIDTLDGTRKNIDKLIIEKNSLEEELKNQEPQVVEKIVEKIPEDYTNTKMDLTAALSKVDDLQSQLDKAIKNVEKLKKTNERLERKQYTLPREIPKDAYKLFQADIKSGLPEIADNSVDFIITDPPYPKDFLPLYKELSKVAARVLKDGGSLVCMVGQSYLPEVVQLLQTSMKYHWCMCYLTLGASPQLWQKRTNTFWKPLLWFVKGEYKGDWIGNDIMESPQNDKNFHHWGQSVGGMKDIIERFTNPNDLILDPFLGGGTTGVTAVMSGRKFIGVDIEEKCLETTLERIKESYGSSERADGLA